MALCDDVLTAGVALPENATATLVRGLDPSWIERMLRATGAASLRRRRLPADQVVWLVIGKALMKSRSIAEVAAKLDIALPSSKKLVVASSALTDARQRLGAAPMQWLFEQTAAAWDQPDEKYMWRGLEVFAVDGTVLRVADSVENSTYFGRHHSGPNSTPSGYPTARLVLLVNVRSRLLRAAHFGPVEVAELTLARDALAAAPPNSLTILDRLYYGSPQLLLVAAEVNRHFLVKTRKGSRWTVIRNLGPGDDLVEIEVTREARIKDPSLPSVWRGRALRYRTPAAEHVLLTSLLDPTTHPAVALCALYHERWEAEIAYDESKTDLLQQDHALRSRTIEGVHQELWGILLSYNLVRREMTVVADEARVSPSRISFTAAYLHIVDEWLWCAIASPGAIPKHLHALRQNLTRFILPERRSNRSNPRVIKRKDACYTRKRSVCQPVLLN
jgi:hypothetical protein